MIRLTALNDDTTSSEETDIHLKEPPQEIQEENALKQYNLALQEQRSGNLEKAEEMYNQLLVSNLLIKVNVDEESVKSKKPDTICSIYAKPCLMLKYSCLKNLAVISQKKNLLNDALDYYTQALAVEGTDVTMWYQSGCIALKLYYMTTALEFFLKGLEYSPRHWPSLDKLIICLFILNDYVNCLHFISKAFELDVHYTRGQVIRNYIFKEQPSLQSDIKHFFPKIDLHINENNEENPEVKEKLLREVVNIRNEYAENRKSQILKNEEVEFFSSFQKIKVPTWCSLGENILQIHTEMTNHEKHISLLTPIKLQRDFTENQFMNGCFSELQAQIKESADNDVTIKKEEENAKEQTDYSCSKKSKKNRGSTLMEELLWGGKRRSARVRSSLRGNPEPMDVAEALRRILPRKLLHKTRFLKGENSVSKSVLEEDSMDTMDLYKLFERQESAEEKRQKEELERSEVEHDIDKIVEKEGYFGKTEEVADVIEFLDSQSGKSIIELLKSYVMALETHWRKTWPNALPTVYIKCYQRMRKYYPMELKMCTTESNFKTLIEESGSILLFGELFLEHSNTIRNKNSSESHLNIIFLQNIMELTNRGDLFESEEKYFEFLVRLYWLRCKIFLEKGQTNLAIMALNNVLACYELLPQFQTTVLHLKNCRKHNIISNAITEEFLAYQSRKRSLAEVVRLYEDESYKELTEILKETFTTTPDTASNYFKDQESELVDRQTQLSMLINGFYHLNEFKECIYWLETCCYELLQKSSVELLSYEEKGESWMVTFDRFLLSIEDCLRLGKITLPQALPAHRLSRFVQTLCHAICKELEDSDRPPCPARPWIMLNTILIGLETDTVRQEDEEENDIPSSVLILFTAHEYLGRREWCNCNESILLFSIMDQVIPHIRKPDWSSFRETVQQHLEQVVYCLYSHPNKKAKARYLTDHNVNSIPLTWQRGIQLFDLFRPDEIPAYDSLRVNLISSDTEVLFRRIAALIPDEKDPVQISDQMTDFIVGKRNDVPISMIRLPETVQDLFYILGDYYFKTHEFAKALNYLLMDLCANPNRVDSWASMALSRASILEQQLNSCDPLKDEVFLQNALSALRCYEHCLQLDNKQCALWIEYGSFVYTIHSFCSQRMKLESDSLSLEQFEELESTKNKMLDTAKQAFINANLIWYELKEEIERQDERWLHHYMLGKICEKNGDLNYFDHYEKAAELLYENQAEFPNKVGYTTPQTLAIEALEVYYRIHVCVIKTLELNEGKPLDSKTRQLFKKHLDLCSKGPFAKQVSKGDLLKLKAKELEVAQQGKHMQEVKNILNDIISKIELGTADTKNEVFQSIKEDKKPVTYDQEVSEVIDITECTDEILKETRDDRFLDSTKDEIIEVKIPEETNKIDSVEENLLKIEIKAVVQGGIEKCASRATVNPRRMSGSVSKPCNNKNYGHYYESQSDNHYITLDDLKSMPQSKPKKKRRVSRASVSSSSCGSEEIRYADDSSCSSSSSASSASSQSTSSSSSDSSQSDASNKETSKASDDDEKQNGNKEKNSEKDLNEDENKEKQNANEEGIENYMLKKCLSAFETCALRFPQHYKSVYRLAHFYFRSKEHRDIGKCRDLLLGRYQTPNGIISGLFAERKNTNFFNGIWRIPAGDVDRPGSFASHMSRSVLLLMEVLRDLKDHKMLLEICLQLRKTPEPDKKYLREDERNQLSVQAYNLSIQTLRKNVKDSSVMTLPIVLDCYRCYQKVQKHYPHKEGVFGDILLEAFKRLGKGDKCSLEQALRFCQSEVSIVKSKFPKDINISPLSTPKPKPLKLKKQEKKKSTPKPQATAKIIQKTPKQKRPYESKKKTFVNAVKPSAIADSSQWNSALKSSEPKPSDSNKPNTTGPQMYAELLRSAALSAKQKEQMEKKSAEQNVLKNMMSQLKPEQTKSNYPGYFQLQSRTTEYGNKELYNQIANIYTNYSSSGSLYNHWQNLKKDKMKMKPQSVLKPKVQKAESSVPNGNRSKTNFNIESILNKPTKLNKFQPMSSSTLSKDIEEKIRSISAEVNVTKCSSQSILNARKNLSEAGKRINSDIYMENITVKKICRETDQTSGGKKNDIEVVVIDD